jgi:hypothetical protein
LAPDSFNKALAAWRPEQGGRPVQALSRISADYMVRAIDETCINETPGVFTGIKAADFDTLFLLRDKLLGLRDRLSSWLLKHTPHLDTDILTTIDTTSAYIWMPLVPKQKKVEGNRKGIWDCSISILGTPLDLRIYLEFGGRARDERERFYRFLASEEYAHFRHQSLAGRGWQVFDIDWYSALFNVRPLDSWQETCSVDINAALAKLPCQGQVDPEPITWNRLAHGFILWKSNLTANQVISFEQVTEKLEQVIALHGEFMKFSSKKITEGEK